MSKKKIIFIAAGVVVLALLVFSGYKLYTGITSFKMAEKNMNLSKKKLRKYYIADPFPSENNIIQEQDNVETLNKWFKTLVDALRKGQLAESHEKMPSKFIDVLTKKRVSITKLAASDTENPVEIVSGEDFALGFKRYSEGDLPDPEYVPRLTQQLAVIEDVCTMMIEEKIDKIVSVQREIIETSGSTPLHKKQIFRARPTHTKKWTGAFQKELVNPDAGIMKPGELYTKFHFIFTIEADEEVLIKVLNRIAQSSMFMSVTGIEIAKHEGDIVLPKPADKDPDKSGGQGTGVSSSGSEALDFILSGGKKPAAPEKTEEDQQKEEKPEIRLSRQQRQVSGDYFEVPLQATIEIDVFRFREAGGS